MTEESNKKEIWIKTSVKELVDFMVAGRFPPTLNPEVVGVFTNANLFAICVHVTEPVATEVAVDPKAALWVALNTMLRFEEGYELVEYLDSKKKPTIGIGHLIRPVDRLTYPKNAEGKLVMTPQQVEDTFRNDTAESIEAAEKWLGDYWQTLNTARQAVAVGMAFQMGVHSLADFGPTREHIIRAEWEEVKKHFLAAKWHSDTPARCERMAEIMVTGKFPEEYSKKG